MSALLHARTWGSMTVSPCGSHRFHVHDCRLKVQGEANQEQCVELAQLKEAKQRLEAQVGMLPGTGNALGSLGIREHRYASHSMAPAPACRSLILTSARRGCVQVVTFVYSSLSYP